MKLYSILIFLDFIRYGYRRMHAIGICNEILNFGFLNQQTPLEMGALWYSLVLFAPLMSDNNENALYGVLYKRSFLLMTPFIKLPSLTQEVGPKLLFCLESHITSIFFRKILYGLIQDASLIGCYKRAYFQPIHSSESRSSIQLRINEILNFLGSLLPIHNIEKRRSWPTILYQFPSTINKIPKWLKLLSQTKQKKNININNIQTEVPRYVWKAKQNKLVDLFLKFLYQFLIFFFSHFTCT